MDALTRALRLVLVTPDDRPATAIRALVEAALEGGVTAVIERERRLHPDERAALAGDLAAACTQAGALLLISGNASLAETVGAAGVQLGWGGPSVAEVRRRHPGHLVGRSCHWPPSDEDRAADFLLLSPFATTHRSHPRPLLTARQIAAVLSPLGEHGGEHGVPCPVVALGGLTESAVSALPSGLAGVAVVRAIADASNPLSAAQALRAAVEARLESPSCP